MCSLVFHRCGRRAVLAGLLCIPLGVFSASTTPQQAFEALVDLEYKREVLGYCGISDPQAVQGFLDRKRRLTREYFLSEARQLEAASDARQAAYAEWQNRGLGGFRGWCRKEGKDYTSTLKKYIEPE